MKNVYKKKRFICFLEKIQEKTNGSRDRPQIRVASHLLVTHTVDD